MGEGMKGQNRRAPVSIDLIATQVSEKCPTVFRQKPATNQNPKQTKRAQSDARLLRSSRHRRFAQWAMLCAALTVSATLKDIGAAVAQPAPFYAGKTLKIIIGVQVGGTSDSFVRGFSTYLQKYLPGSPTILVQNMTGAGSNVVFNYLAELAPRDGLTIVYNPYQAMAQALGDPSLRARFENFEYLGGVSDTKILYMRSDAVPGGARKPADIAKADGIIAGAYTNADLGGMMSRLSLDVLGVRHKVVTGYRGGGDIFLALQRGEVQFHNTSVGTYRTRSATFVRSGEGLGIAYLVAVGPNGEFDKDKYITEVPPFPDLYRELTGRLPSGSTWNALNWLTTQTGELTYAAFAPRGTPPAVLATLRTAFKQAFSDPDFIKGAIATNGIPYGFVEVERGQSIIRSLVETSPEVLTTLRAVMGQK
jgi:tripartite-type tricarboxylate transporter receptor subunit TctC